MATDFDPTSVDLTAADPRDIVCYLSAASNEYDGRLGARISALFVILVVSSAATFFPVVAARVKWLRINIYVYLFARYFGAGVILATAFIHLLDPAYSAIGPNTCVGMTGHWADYSWCPAIVLTSITVVFLLDFGAEQYVERKYGFGHGPGIDAVITTCTPTCTTDDEEAGHAGSELKRHSHDHIHVHDKRNTHGHPLTHNQLHSGDQDEAFHAAIFTSQPQTTKDLSSSPPKDHSSSPTPSLTTTQQIDRSFRQQIAAFLILEFGVIFHSIIIGLNLGTAGPEFTTLYPVLVFHQSFEGLGIGARMSAIPFPSSFSWLPWALCMLYGLTTPLAIAIGLGVHTTYVSGSFEAKVVGGVFDAVSAGVLIYTALVELLARDFLFNPELTRSKGRLGFMVVCVLVGAGVMALLGKWA